MTHEFVLQPGNWLGEGTIKFTESPEWLKYYCRWSVQPAAHEGISALQEIEVEGVPDKMENVFAFSNVASDHLDVYLNNALLGEINGKGVIDEKVIAWEFRGLDQYGFEGFEIYELQADGGYLVRAEYTSADQLRTLIEGRIWKKAETSPP